MSQRLAHRGPDDQGCLRFDGKHCAFSSDPAESESPARAVLMHRRLSIIDLSATGRQPMVTPDGRYAICYNGEIYNYLELRRELESQGVSFRSTSDTEVLLQCLAHWGPAATLPRLTGMFAFALLDTQRRTLLLARDPFGIKPLYYAEGPHGFAFASEIKALLELPNLDRSVDPARLYLYLRYGTTDHGGNTLLANIRQVPAGHSMEVSLDNARPAAPLCYWRLNTDRPVDLSFDEAARHLRELFLDNVRLHLRSDVAVGACLSGGIDSSAVVMAMRHLQGDSLDLHTFGYIGDDPAINEERWIDRVSTAASTTCHKTRPGPADVVRDLPALIDTQDEPFGSTSIFAQRCVFAAVRDAGIKVVLDGQGADELLAGYRPYRAARLASLVRSGRWGQAYGFLRRAMTAAGGGESRLLLQAAGMLLPRPLRDRLRGLVGEELLPAWLNAKWFERHSVRPTSVGQSTGRDRLRQALLRTLTETSLPMLLRYEDRNSMAFSIESRVPFLTPAFSEFCLNLPESYLIAPDGTSKAVFRAAMRGLVPDDVLDRRDKIGFATPEQAWLGSLQSWVQDVLDSSTAAGIPALQLPALRTEWQAVLAGRRRFDFRVWRWVNLIRWAERFNVTFPR